MQHQHEPRKITFVQFLRRPWTIVSVVAAAIPAFMGASVIVARPEQSAKPSTSQVATSDHSVTNFLAVGTPQQSKDFYLAKADAKLVRIPVNEKIGRANVVLGIGPDASGHPQEVAVDLDFKTGRGVILPDPGCDLDKPACKTDSGLGERVQIERGPEGALRVRVMNTNGKTAFGQVTLTPDADGKLRVSGNTSRFQNVSVGQVHNGKATVLQERVPNMVPVAYTASATSMLPTRRDGDSSIGYEHCGWYTCKTFLTRQATADLAQWFDDWDRNSDLGAAAVVTGICAKAPLPKSIKGLCFFIGMYGGAQLVDKSKQAKDQNACIRFMYSRAVGSDFGGGVDIEINNGKHCVDR